jgi:hypothetical protein
MVADNNSGENIMSTEKLTTPIGDLEFVLDGYPTKETAQKLFDALDFQRACQAYLDFMPAMSMYSLLEGQEKGWGDEKRHDTSATPAHGRHDQFPHQVVGVRGWYPYASQ